VLKHSYSTLLTKSLGAAVSVNLKNTSLTPGGTTER